MTGLIGFGAGVAGLPWKIATGVAGLSTIVAAGFLLSAQIENRHLRKIGSELEQRINAPGTGYVSQVAQATTNVAQLKTAIAHQRVLFETAAKADRDRLARLEADIRQVRIANNKLRADSAAIAKTPPHGDTLEARVLDIDARVLETLE